MWMILSWRQVRDVGDKTVPFFTLRTNQWSILYGPYTLFKHRLHVNMFLPLGCMQVLHQLVLHSFLFPLLRWNWSPRAFWRYSPMKIKICSTMFQPMIAHELNNVGKPWSIIRYYPVLTTRFSWIFENMHKNCRHRLSR